jgi:predicted P-loop ATPase
MMTDVIPLNAWKGQLQRDDKQGVRKNLTNLMVHLRNLAEFGKQLRFNEMTQQMEWRGDVVEDPHIIDMRLILEREGFPPPERDVRPAAERVARENSYNPIADYLNGLTWDRKPRIERWMISLLGAPDTPFVRLVSPKVLISAVARTVTPGCKVDTVLVLEGEQGIKKSSAIAALFGEDYTAESVSLFDQHNKMVMAMMGAWVVELAEFVAIINKTSNHATAKGLISMTKDRVVLPYAKMASTHPRRCIFFGTINPEDVGYLTDSTGNRRYWPVAVSKINIDGIRQHRDQLWAEAIDRFRAGERWWLEAEEEATAQEVQSEREEEDAWTEPLSIKLQKQGWPVEMTADQALSMLEIPHERKSRREQNRVARVLKALGYERTTARPVGGGKPRKVWKRSQ